MSLHDAVRTLPVAAAFVLAVPTSIDSMRWWRSPPVASHLRLSPVQAEAIERIYQGSRVQAAACARESAAARRELDALLMSDGTDDAYLVTSRVADTEAVCQRMRKRMLYRMFRQLSPRQRQALHELAGPSAAEGTDHGPDR